MNRTFLCSSSSGASAAGDPAKGPPPARLACDKGRGGEPRGEERLTAFVGAGLVPALLLSIKRAMKYNDTPFPYEENPHCSGTAGFGSAGHALRPGTASSAVHPLAGVFARAGAYSVTVCTWGKKCMFGDVVDGTMRLNGVGRMVETVWRSLPDRFPAMGLDEFVVMPNHVHGVIVLDHVHHSAVQATIVGTSLAGARPTLGQIVGAFKSISTVKCLRQIKGGDLPPSSGRLWQRNYYEHVIRDEDSLNRIRQYILENVVKWAEDPENPMGM
jgi:putative transposase